MRRKAYRGEEEGRMAQEYTEGREGDVEEDVEDPSMEAEGEEEIANKDLDDLERMAPSPRLMHHLTSALHGVKDVMGAHCDVEPGTPGHKILGMAGKAVNSLEEQIRDHYGKNYPNEKDLPVYDMGDGMGDKGDMDDDDDVAPEGEYAEEDEDREHVEKSYFGGHLREEENGDDEEAMLLKSIQRKRARLAKLSGLS
jgi:hypothetical protein